MNKSSGLNFTFTCYDDVALSIINDFWQHSDKIKKDINVNIVDRYAPYPVEKPSEKSPEIKYEVISTGNESDPFRLHSLSSSITSVSSSSEDSSFLSSESCLSVLSSTVDSIDIPTELLENIEDFPTIDENALYEALQKIENETVSSTTELETLSSHSNDDEPIYVSKLIRNKRLASEKRVSSRIPDPSKEFCCVACDKYFKFRSGLRKHFRTKTHQKVVEMKGLLDPEELPDTWSIYRYSCFVCGQGFVRENQVIEHIKIH